MNIYNWNFINILFNDAPEPWQIGFQDSATPGFSGIIELHNTLFFYLIVIVVGVFWVLGSIILNFNSTKSAIAHKYLNHGINVPIQKCYNAKYSSLKTNLPLFIRTYSTLPKLDSKPNISEVISNPSVIVYEDAFSMKKEILKENTGKSGIYMLTNKLTGDIYIGQSYDLSKRFKKYFNLSYINSKKNLIISRALIKYGYSNFSVTILEYCKISDLLTREQFYLDNLNPKYNILKIAGSSMGFKHSEESNTKKSIALKGIYTGENSPLFGRNHTEDTKKLMSLKKTGDQNPLYGKNHKESTKELIREKALGRKFSEESKLKMSAVRGNTVNIYEKFSKEGFKLIGSFVSARRASKFLGISGSTVIKYLNSGAIFKERYKFSPK